MIASPSPVQDTYAGAQLLAALARVGTGAPVHDDRGHASWRHGLHRVTIAPDWEAPSRDSVRASSPAEAVRGSSLTARPARPCRRVATEASATGPGRSEEHTSELQSR